MKTFFFILCLINIYNSPKVYAIRKDDLELERQLQLINKTPIKSIQVYILLLSYYILIFLKVDMIT